MVFANLLIFLFFIPVSVSFNAGRPPIPKSSSMMSLNSVNAGIPKAASYPIMLGHFKSAEQTQLYSPTLDYALNSARRLTTATRDWLKNQRTKSAPSNTFKNRALVQQNLNTEAFEKRIVEYGKKSEEIENMKEKIASQENLQRKNAQIKADLEKKMRGYKSDYTVGDRQEWMQSRKAMLNNMKNLAVLNWHLNKMNAEADKFHPEVIEGYNQRKSAERKLNARHEVYIANGSHF